MPELPEIEIIRTCLEQKLLGKTFKEVAVYQKKLRYPVPHTLAEKLSGNILCHVERRGKYLLLGTLAGWMIMHFGMSGRAIILSEYSQPQKHDHIDWFFEDRTVLRYRDPRKFGSVLWVDSQPYEHRVLRDIALEPLGDAFDATYLIEQCRNRARCIKGAIMDSCIVAGVGNIYANEALFHARISPKQRAGLLSERQLEKLVFAIKKVLRKAIQAGGTTLKDYVDPMGNVGWFALENHVYQRDQMPCLDCGTKIRRAVLCQRSTFWCPRCQR